MKLTKEETPDQALRLARGSYQRNILCGNQLLSGADLRGAAKSYSNRYRNSARSIMRRVKEAGLNITEQIGAHNKRLVVVCETEL